MKFLSKNPESEILKRNLIYKKGNSKNNKELKEFLIKEQFNFCAYTEKYFENLDSIDVEHFNSSLKYTNDDGYFNYYAVLASINNKKKDEEFENASFFKSRFYQNKEELISLNMLKVNIILLA